MQESLFLQIKKHLKPKTIFLFQGGLGAGKTTLIREILEQLGFHLVASPTFALHQNFKNQFYDIDHLDLYRLENDAEIETSGLWDLFQDQNKIIFVEWPQRVPKNHWPLDWQKVWVEMSGADHNYAATLRLED